MRFHIGCSFRPKTLIKYIGLGFLGLLAFLGFSKGVNADSISYSSLQVNNNSNQTTLSCNYDSSKVCPIGFPYNGYVSGVDYLGRHFIINFDNVTLTSGHDYSIDLNFMVVHPPSLNDFEQESFLFYQLASGYLNDTTITWSYHTYYDQSFDYYVTEYTYSGQFTATSTSTFYADLKTEQQEAFYAFAVGSIHLVDNSTGDELIQANYENTQNIINNNNSNTSQIINSINDNLNSCRESLNLYKYGDLSITSNYYFENRILLENFENNTTYTLSFDMNTSLLPYYIFIGYGDSTYSSDIPTYKSYETNGKAYITFTTNNTTYHNLYMRIPRYSTSGTSWTAKLTNIMLTKGNMVLPYEVYGKQICSNKIDNLNDSINNTNQSIQELNDTITDDTIDTTTSNDFFDNFSDNHHGLSGIVSLPLTTIQSLNNATCSPLTLTIPYLQSNNTLQLPCLTPIYQQNFGVFFTLYQTIIFGFVSYYVCVNIFYMVKDFKDPNKDKIEVMDL